MVPARLAPQPRCIEVVSVLSREFASSGSRLLHDRQGRVGMLPLLSQRSVLGVALSLAVQVLQATAYMVCPALFVPV